MLIFIPPAVFSSNIGLSKPTSLFRCLKYALHVELNQVSLSHDRRGVTSLRPPFAFRAHHSLRAAPKVQSLCSMHLVHTVPVAAGLTPPVV